MRRAFGIAATSVVLMLAVPVVAGCGTGTPTTSSSASSSSVTTATTTGPGATSPSAPGASTSPTAAFAYVPLWPFGTVEAAQQWQTAGSAGHQPWRLDAAAVALAFTRQYLGFTEIDRVLDQHVSGAEAHVSVGYATEGGHTGTAAVLHLVRIGAGASAPWEVVGTDDTEHFSLTQPRYGATVGASLTAGGHISGVDESIRVTARQLTGVIGGYCCLPAGGGEQGQSWAVRLPLTGARPGPVTVVASTGGHLQGVERFTITGARVQG